MQINVFSIQKNKDEFKQIEEYIKMSSSWANLVNLPKFNQNIAKAQEISKEKAQISYEQIYEPYLSGFCVGLDEKGKELDSIEFAKLLKNKTKISFFIGGAYGFNKSFKAKMDQIISLSKFTLAHKIAKLVLFEQIYRALSINANHPYNKI